MTWITIRFYLPLFVFSYIHTQTKHWWKWYWMGVSQKGGLYPITDDRDHPHHFPQFLMRKTYLFNREKQHVLTLNHEILQFQVFNSNIFVKRCHKPPHINSSGWCIHHVTIPRNSCSQELQNGQVGRALFGLLAMRLVAFPGVRLENLLTIFIGISWNYNGNITGYSDVDFSSNSDIYVIVVFAEN